MVKIEGLKRGTERCRKAQLVQDQDGETLYCRGRDYGVCDTRTGLCLCKEGYAGEGCELCEDGFVDINGTCLVKSKKQDPIWRIFNGCHRGMPLPV